MVSLFNIISSTPALFLLTMISFFFFFTLRQLCIKRKIFIFLYHLCLFCILFIAAMGAAAVQNGGYSRLEKFMILEKNGQLKDAKKNLDCYDAMLYGDLQEFRDSAEFKAYLKKDDAYVGKAEAVFVGWLIALIVDSSLVLIQLLSYLLT